VAIRKNETNARTHPAKAMPRNDFIKNGLPSKRTNVKHTIMHPKNSLTSPVLADDLNENMSQETSKTASRIKKIRQDIFSKMKLAWGML